MSFLMGLALPGLHAATQILAKPRMRAVSSAFNLIALSVVGSGLGTALIGIATDQLSSRFGQDAIRYSLLMSVAAALGAGIFSWRAAESLERDIGAVVPGDL
jgi:hypothetical protein